MEYVDLIQPIQVAVYEMKLGLAIALSGYLEREYLKKIKEDDIERALVCVAAMFESYLVVHFFWPDLYLCHQTVADSNK